jgi:hypothetical protein
MEVDDIKNRSRMYLNQEMVRGCERPFYRKVDRIEEDYSKFGKSSKTVTRMAKTGDFFTDDDLGLLADIAAPGHSDRQRMIRTMREDDEILQSVISDRRVFEHFTKNQESPLRVSPLLFFTALLVRAKNELKNRPYTVEQESRRRMYVFDSGAVADLLEREGILPYLADLLASFVKIDSFSVMTRVRPGVWNRFRFSDFDVEDLIRYSRLIEEGRRFFPYKRIADICLFVSGVFPDFVASNELNRDRRAGGLAQFSREDFSNRGTHFYRAAALHDEAVYRGVREVLLKLSEDFELAVKPLSYLSTHYLGLLKNRVFLQ